MKRRFIFTMILLLLFSYNSINGYEYHNEINTIEYLLNERIKVINEFLYSCQDMDSLEKKLNKIESGNLLQNDLDILNKVIDCPTDYELAMNVEIHKINSIELTECGYSVNADLNWLMRGYDGEFNLVKNYHIKCVEQDNKVYLAKLMILNNNTGD